MSNRSWYYAAQGQQQGPLSEAELRDLIARGGVTADTLVWSDGMAAWEKAGRIPGLIPGAATAAPPPMAQPAGYNPGGYATYDDGQALQGARLSIDIGLWSYLGWTLLYGIGQIFVIPAPWTATALYRYVAERTKVPGRGRLGFAGQPLDIWYVLMGIALLMYVSAGGFIIQLVAIAATAYLSWMVLRWVLSKLLIDGRPAGISFEGGPLPYVGFYLLLVVSIVTIVGWAWVTTAWMRWICNNIGGTRRAVVFDGSGIEVLWRGIVVAIGCFFIIPIPWVISWYTRWFMSQIVLVPRA